MMFADIIICVRKTQCLGSEVKTSEMLTRKLGKTRLKSFVACTTPVDNNILIYDLLNYRIVQKIPCRQDQRQLLRWLNENELAVGKPDAISVWSISEQSYTKSIFMENSVCVLCLATQQSHVIWTTGISQDVAVGVWNTTTNEEQKVILPIEDGIMELALDRHKTYFYGLTLVGIEATVITKWSTFPLQCVSKYRVESAGIIFGLWSNSIVVSPDDTFIIDENLAKIEKLSTEITYIYFEKLDNDTELVYFRDSATKIMTCAVQNTKSLVIEQTIFTHIELASIPFVVHNSTIVYLRYGCLYIYDLAIKRCVNKVRGSFSRFSSYDVW
jgi:hypothetical protein